MPWMKTPKMVKVKFGRLARRGVIVALVFLAGRYSHFKTDVAPPPPARTKNPVPDNNQSPAGQTADHAKASTGLMSRTMPTEALRGEGREERMFVLPASLLMKIGNMPSFNYTTGKFEISSLMNYGINAEKAEVLQGKIDDLIEAVKIREGELSSLRKDPDGGEYFLIPPFPEEGRILKQQLEEAVRGAFEVRDDRTELLIQSLAKHGAFSSFGENRMEVAIEHQSGTDGGRTGAYVVRTYFSDGKMLVNHAIPATLKYAADRFRLLSERNLKLD